MIDRRNFLNVLTASATMAAVPAALQTAKTSQSRLRISLNGEWEEHREGKVLRCGDSSFLSSS